MLDTEVLSIGSFKEYPALEARKIFLTYGQNVTEYYTLRQT